MAVIFMSLFTRCVVEQLGRASQALVAIVIG